MKKNIYWSILLLTQLLTLTGTKTFAHDIAVTNDNGVTIYYLWTNNKTELAVSYYGISPVSYSDEYIGSVIIPDFITYNGTSYPVTSIGDNAFYECSNLISVTIGHSVTSIGENAFSGCSNLATITIPSSVTSIGANAFKGTMWYENLPDGLICGGKVVYSYKGIMPANTNVEIKDGIVSISPEAFYNCSGMTSITIPNTVTSIGAGAFLGCSGLTSIAIPYSVTSINCEMFSGCSSLTSFTIPSTITSIGRSAFQECSSLTEIIIPNSVTSIEERAFYDCFSLTNIVIPNSVENIADEIFYGCRSLTSVTIPASVTSIGLRSFAYCSSLLSIVIPDGVTSIKDETFIGCLKLNNIIIPESVTNIGVSAFKRCESLISVTIPNSVTSIGESAFRECYGMENVTIPSSMTTIDISTFRGCSALKSITIPKSVTHINNSAFYGCSSMTCITMGNSVTSIGNYAFSGCSAIENVIVPVSDYAAFCNNTIVNLIMQHIEKPIILTDNKGNDIKVFYIPEGVSSIGNYAFYKCSSLTRVIIPNSVTTIRDNAFAEMEKVENIICYAEKVPQTHQTAFEGSYIDYATLHVPANALEDYKATKPWSQFGKIVPLTEEELDISTPSVAKEAEPKEWFTLDGQHISKLQKGLNIVVMQDGTVKKIVVKDKR